MEWWTVILLILAVDVYIAGAFITWVEVGECESWWARPLLAVLWPPLWVILGGMWLLIRWNP